MVLGLVGGWDSEVKSAKDFHHCEGLRMRVGLDGGEVGGGCLGSWWVGYGGLVLVFPLWEVECLDLDGLGFGAG
jgi:hypothetical protein